MLLTWLYRHESFFCAWWEVNEYLLHYQIPNCQIVYLSQIPFDERSFCPNHCLSAHLQVENKTGSEAYDRGYRNSQYKLSKRQRYTSPVAKCSLSWPILNLKLLFETKIILSATVVSIDFWERVIVCLKNFRNAQRDLFFSRSSLVTAPSFPVYWGTMICGNWRTDKVSSVTIDPNDSHQVGSIPRSQSHTNMFSLTNYFQVRQVLKGIYIFWKSWSLQKISNLFQTLHQQHEQRKKWICADNAVCVKPWLNQ